MSITWQPLHLQSFLTVFLIAEKCVLLSRLTLLCCTIAFGGGLNHLLDLFLRESRVQEIERVAVLVREVITQHAGRHPDLREVLPGGLEGLILGALAAAAAVAGVGFGQVDHPARQEQLVRVF